jgi:hypothetical protein
LGPEVAGRHVEPGQAQVAAGLGQGRQVVVGPGVQKLVLAQGAGGHQAHHVAPHHGLAAALLGLGRVFHLLADGHLEAAADQPREVAVGGMDRHAAHGNVLAQVPAPLGERNVQGRRGLDRVVEEQLVEIAHAIEQQAVGMVPLDLQVLHHHGRDRGLGGPGSG